LAPNLVVAVRRRFYVFSDSFASYLTSSSFCLFWHIFVFEYLSTLKTFSYRCWTSSLIERNFCQAQVNVTRIKFLSSFDCGCQKNTYSVVHTQRAFFIYFIILCFPYLCSQSLLILFSLYLFPFVFIYFFVEPEYWCKNHSHAGASRRWVCHLAFVL